MKKENEKEQEKKAKSLRVSLKDGVAMFIALLESAFLPLIIFAAIMIFIVVIITIFL